MPHAGVLAFVVFPALLLLWSLPTRFAGSPWAALVVALAFGATHVREALANIRAPREWDYGCFWLYARVAHLHENLYDPRVFASVALPFHTDDAFRQAVLDVGFPYPPPSIVLLLPLGGIDGVSQGLAWWYLGGLAAFVAAVAALQRAFFPGDGLRGGVLVAALILMLPAASSNTSQAQTNVVVLALLALAFLVRDSAWGACLGALAIWVKPYAAILSLSDLAAGRFRRVAVTLATVAVSLAVSVALVGPATFATYVRSNPALREPTSAFAEAVNQSLLAGLLRANHATLGRHLSLAHEPLFLAIAAALVAATAWLCGRYPEQSDLTFSLTLLLGLLIYPGTLDAYGTVLVLPLLVLWSRRHALPVRSAGVAVLAGCAILLQGPLHAGLLANAACWTACALALPSANAARLRG